MLGLLLLAAGHAASARADLWVKEKITGGDGKPLGERISVYTAHQFRIDQGGSGLLVDAQQGRGWIYGGASGVCEALALRPAAAAGSPAAVPSAEENRFGAVLQGLSGTGVVITPRHENRTVAGVEADRYDFVSGPETIQRRWLASSLSTPAYDDLVRGWMSSGRLGLLMGIEEGQIVVQSLGIGYPMRVEDLRTGVVSEAIEIRTGAQPASAFTPPPACAGR